MTNILQMLKYIRTKDLTNPNPCTQSKLFITNFTTRKFIFLHERHKPKILFVLDNVTSLKPYHPNLGHANFRQVDRVECTTKIVRVYVNKETQCSN